MLELANIYLFSSAFSYQNVEMALQSLQNECSLYLISRVSEEVHPSAVTLIHCGCGILFLCLRTSPQVCSYRSGTVPYDTRTLCGLYI